MWRMKWNVDYQSILAAFCCSCNRIMFFCDSEQKASGAASMLLDVNPLSLWSCAAGSGCTEETITPSCGVLMMVVQSSVWHREGGCDMTRVSLRYISKYQGFIWKLVRYKGISFFWTYLNSLVFLCSKCTIQSHIINLQPFLTSFVIFHAFTDYFEL